MQQICILPGHGVVLQHFRQNAECNELEELQPIDSNLNYDSNYQVIETKFHWTSCMLNYSSNVPLLPIAVQCSDKRG